jgi:transcriptional regulator with XRE-family HTH domain
MTTKQQRLKEVYDHLRAHYGIHTQIDFAEAISITRPALSSAMNGNEAYLTKNLFQKICGAFPGVFNIDYLLTGKGSLLTIEEDVKSEEIEKQNRPIDQSSLVNSALAAKDETIAAKEETIASLREQIQAKDELIAALRQQIDILQQQVHAAKDEELFKNFPFPNGVADKKDADNAHV